MNEVFRVCVIVDSYDDDGQHTTWARFPILSTDNHKEAHDYALRLAFPEKRKKDNNNEQPC